VYIYNNAADELPDATITNTFGGSFGSTLRALGNDLLVSITGSNDGDKGVIARYDTTTGSLINSYENTLTVGNDFFGSQMTVQGTNVYAYGFGDNGATVFKLDTDTSATTGVHGCQQRRLQLRPLAQRHRQLALHRLRG